MVVIEVYDEDTMKNEFIGWTSIPILCLKKGYRNISLLNSYLKPIPDSSLFANISITELWSVKTYNYIYLFICKLICF